MPQIRYKHTVCLLFIFTMALAGCGASPIKQSDLRGDQVVSQATTLIGKPYQYGGNTPKGFDCSGLVQYTHNKAGVQVPRTTRDQLKQAKRINRSQLIPGDLVFFRINGRKVSHVGIYVGNNQMIHAPSSGKRVSYASLDNAYWKKRIIATGRLY